MKSPASARPLLLGIFASAIFLAVSALEAAPYAHDQYLNVLTNASTSLRLTGDDGSYTPPACNGLGYILLTQPTKGTLTGTPPTLVYTPTNFTGTDSFTFKVNKGAEDSTNVATVYLLLTNKVGAVRPGPDRSVFDTNSIGAPLGHGDEAYMYLDFTTSPYLDRLGRNLIFKALGTFYTGLYISINGNISFSNGTPNYANMLFPFNPTQGKMFAPFYGDVDTRPAASGVPTIWQGYVDGQRAVAVTWRNVGYYREKTDKRNTFQIVLIDHDGISTEAEYNYDEISWSKADSMTIHARAGWDAGDGVGYSNLPFSGTADVTNLVNLSNVGVPGRFRFFSQPGTVSHVLYQDVGDILPHRVTLIADISAGTNTATWFQYGLTTNLGPAISAGTLPATACPPQRTSLQISNLLGNTTYYFRTITSNAFGLYTSGISAFVTPTWASHVFTLPATEVAADSATLQGLVYQDEYPTDVWFTWSTNTSARQAIGSGIAGVNVSQAIGALSAGQLYTFRLHASNELGVVSGDFYNFTTGIPALTSLVWTNAPTAGGSALTLTGTNFVPGSIVTFNGQIRSLTSYSSTQLVVTVPAGQGTNLPVTVTSGGVTAAPRFFNYDRPQLAQLTLPTGPTSGGYTNQLDGLNFGTNGTLTVGGSFVTVVSYAQTAIRFLQPAGEGTGLQVQLTVGGQTPVAPLTFSYAAPQISSLTPTNGPTFGSLAQLTGTSFGITHVVRFDGVSRQIFSSDHTNISFLTPVGQGAGHTVQVEVGGQLSSARTYNYNPPVISLLDPDSGPTNGGTFVTIQGSNFGTNGTVTLAGIPCVVSNYSHGSIRFVLPPGQGSNQPVVVTVSGQTNAPALFHYSIRGITGIAPATGSTKGETLVTLTGTNFGTDGYVLFQNMALGVLSYSETNVVFSTPDGEGANLPVRVVTYSGQTAGPIYFSYDRPVITQLTPSTGGTLGGAGISIRGTNFGLTPVVTFNGLVRSSSAQGHTNISFTLPAGQGTNNLVVVTVGGQSNSTPLFFRYTPPALAFLSASTGPTAGGRTLQLFGSNLGVSNSVTLGGVNGVILSNTASSVFFTLPAGQGTNLSLVINVSGQTGTLAEAFSYEAPQIFSCAPSTGPTLGGTPVVLTGTNFGTAPVVTCNGQPCVITSSNHAQLTFLTPPGQGTNQTILLNVGGQLAAPQTFSYGPPAIDLMSPTNGPTAGGTVVTLTGSSFGTNGTVRLNGAVCAISFSSHTNLQFTVPAGQGTNFSVTVTVNAQVSGAKFFSYDPPAITTLSPANGPAAGGIEITIEGNNFGTNAGVSIGGAAATVTAVNPTQIKCVLPAGTGLNRSVVVTVSGQSSAAGLFSYYGLPAVTTLGAAEDGTVSGTVNPNGAATRAYFQFGTGTNYAGVSADTLLPVAVQTFALTNLLPGLSSGTVYHYRLVAENLAGTNYGADRVFTNQPFADLAVTVTATPEPVGAGTNLTYAITVTNAGPNPAGDIAVTNTLPDNVTGVTAPGGTYAAGRVVYLLDRLEVGRATNLTVVVTTLPWVNDLTNTVTVSSRSEDLNLANNTASVISSGPPLLLAGPVARTNAAGTTATFTVSVQGSYLGYQWFKESTPLAGATISTLVLTNVLVTDTGSYSVTVSNAAGLASASATLSVLDAAVITSNPTNVTVGQGENAVFAVGATGSALGYQWYFGADALSGATASGLTVTNAQTNHVGNYYAIVSNSLSVGTSVVATLTIVADTNTPVLKVVAPKAKTNATVAGVYIAGTVADDKKPAHVYYRINGGTFTDASLSYFLANKPTNWTGQVTAVPGTNLLDVYATDVAGNRTVTNTILFFYDYLSTFRLNVNLAQQGTFFSKDGAVDGAQLKVGRTYNLVVTETNKPAYVFSNWTYAVDGGPANQFATNVLKLSFLMQTNLTLNANFAYNTLMERAGIYSGLFHENDGIKHVSAGFLTAKVTEKFAVSGKLYVDGNVVSYSGKLAVDGTLPPKVLSRAKLADKSDLLLSLGVNLTGSNVITGTLQDDTNWTSSFTADRWTWTNDAIAYTNAYTLVLPAFTNSNAGPGGHGFVTVVVSQPGKVKIAGLSGDNQKLGQSTYLGGNGTIPFWVGLYLNAYEITNADLPKVVKETKGEMMGWLEIRTNIPANSVHLAPLGDVVWIKTGGTNPASYLMGFTNQADVLASRWLPPTPLVTTNSAGFTAATATVDEGYLGTPFTQTFTASAKNAFVLPKATTNVFKISLAPKTGLIKGQFNHPDLGAAVIKWNGTLLQDYTNGYGSFMATNVSGKVMVTPMVLVP